MTVPGRTDDVGVDDLLGALAVLTDHPTPRGHERETATELARWAGGRWPHLRFRVDEIGSDGANLVCFAGTPSSSDLVLYSHLDTSLTGIGDLDRAVTGVADDAATGMRFDGVTVSGFGLGVARGPAAGALIGFAAAATTAGPDSPLGLVLAGGGTHENSIPLGSTDERVYCGLERHLQSYPTPRAAVVAKSGPKGILWDEPGAGYLRVRVVGGSRGAVLLRDLGDPPGGLPAHVGTVCDAVESWRTRFVASGFTGGQAGREVGIGAITAGSTRKPDLLPAHVDLHLYVVTTIGDDMAELADELRRTLLERFEGGPLARCSVQVDRSTPHAAAGTEPSAPVVRSAVRVWEQHFGEAVPHLSRWTGSTDGVVLRGSGVDTVRLGPTSVTDDNDPAWDAVQVADLMRCARVYRDIGTAWAGGVEG